FSPSVFAIRAAAARAASRRGSKTRIFLSAAHVSAASTSGTRVVLPAPGGATSTAVVPRARAATRSGVAASIGRGANAVISLCREHDGVIARSSRPMTSLDHLAGQRSTLPSSVPKLAFRTGHGVVWRGRRHTYAGPMSQAAAPRKLKKGDHVFLIDGS